MASEGGTKAIIAALIANVGISIAKFVGWGFTGSSAMLAEGIHSFADSGNQMLLLLGGRWAKRPADDIHQFGYGRERFFWAFIVSLILFSLGSVFSLYEGIHKLVNPHKPENLIVALIILAVAILLEGYSFITAWKEANKLRGNYSLWEFIHITRNPELPVVLLEDSGALVGLVIAFISVLLSELVNPVFDAIGTICIGLLLGAIAIFLAVETKSMLIGEGASEQEATMIRKVIDLEPGIVKLLNMRTLHTAPEEFMLAIKVEMDSTLSYAEVADQVNALEMKIREVVPHARYIFIEPGLDGQG
ncbi:cation diffusion facilitator family transporter [Stomatohabitans albus]|uniref:cation diffusion facilitator family transporter n=1 Tax=Stomatohabitans albus TaxID=3110766 RepID=UPI00300D2DF5